MTDFADTGPGAIGTGRVAVPLAERGVEVAGIELSAPMVEVLHRKRPGLPVAIGDMAVADAPPRGRRRARSRWSTSCGTA